MGNCMANVRLLDENGRGEKTTVKKKIQKSRKMSTTSI